MSKLFEHIDAVLAAGPLPPRECGADLLTDYEIGESFWEVIGYQTNNFPDYEAMGKMAKQLFQPSPASGEQNTPASTLERGKQSGAKEDDGARQSAAGESPAPTPPAPAATRVAVQVLIERYGNGPWVLFNPACPYPHDKSGRYETFYTTIAADRPGDGG
jgi:hypothetical protein